jgi:excinuclease ABC subunit B
MDADKEGFLRNERSLTQTIGRAARNSNGKVIMYADTITKSMQRTIDETDRRREKQLKYNAENNITPQTIYKTKEQIIQQASVLKGKNATAASSPYIEAENELNIAADPVVQYMNKEQLQKTINNTRKKMETAAKDMNFVEAARLRDEMYSLQELMKDKN